MVDGRDRERFLASQLTSHVVALAEDESQPSALLDRSGRLRAAFFVVKRRDRFELLVPSAALDECIGGLADNVIADDVEITRCETGEMRLALGPAAAAAPPDPCRIPVAGWGSRGYVTWDPRGVPLPEIPPDELEARRVLGGPPAWGREVVAGQLINETGLLDTAVSFDKGCYLGQETVAKLASHRGAVRGPVLLEADESVSAAEALVGQRFAAGGRDRAGEIRSAAGWNGRTYLQASLHRELRVIGRELHCELSSGTLLRTVVRRWPLLPPPSRRELADRLTVAASAAFAEDRSERAIELLERALAVCPDFADATESLGVILGRLGRTEEAIAWMKRLLEVEPSSVMAHSNLSLFYNKIGDIEAAERHLAEATRASFAGGAPADPAVEAAAEAEAREADRSRREEMFRRVLEIDPDDPLAHFGLGELAVERERFADAVDHLERAIAADPGHSAAMLALGAALEGLDDRDRALEVYERGVEIAAGRGDLATAQKMQDRLNALASRAR